MRHTRKESYSSLSLFSQCPYNYYLKYVKGNYSDKSTIPLEIGSLIHGVMEEKKRPDNFLQKEKLLELFKTGKKCENAMDSFIGIEEIQDKYLEDFLKAGRKSGLTYNQKLTHFHKRIDNEDENGVWEKDREWNTLAVEFPFEIKCHGVSICGKIDLVEINKEGRLRITDYKTSDTCFEESKLKSPLQMYIYALACKQYFNKYPVEFVYDLILLGRYQYAMGDNWEKLGERELKRIIGKLLVAYETEEFCVKPSPLCYWCVYNKDGLVQDDKTRLLCDFYSLWTPEDKTWSVNKKWEKDKNMKQNLEESKQKKSKSKEVVKTLDKEFVW